MIRISITGPESSGKTTLATSLAEHYQVPWVKEYSREYLDNLNRMYNEADLLAIAAGQVSKEQAVAGNRNLPLLICDTDLTVIAIWSLVRYGSLHPELARLEMEQQYELTLLCKPDIPWEPDELRENPHDRDRLFALYHERLSEQGRPFIVIEGAKTERTRVAVKHIDDLI